MRSSKRGIETILHYEAGMCRNGNVLWYLRIRLILGNMECVYSNKREEKKRSKRVYHPKN